MDNTELQRVLNLQQHQQHHSQLGQHLQQQPTEMQKINQYAEMQSTTTNNDYGFEDCLPQQVGSDQTTNASLVQSNMQAIGNGQHSSHHFVIGGTVADAGATKRIKELEFQLYAGHLCAHCSQCNFNQQIT